MNVVLIGFMGTGKSAIGRALADHLGTNFLDTDAEIEREAGKPIRRIFAEEGEDAFRALEAGLLQRLSSAPAPGIVLATGGGTPMLDENVGRLRQIGAVIWLTAPAEVILQRVGPDLSLRPLLAAYAGNPLARIEGLLTERGPRYAAAADLIWDTSNHASSVAAAASLAEELCQPVP